MPKQRATLLAVDNVGTPSVSLLNGTAHALARENESASKNVIPVSLVVDPVEERENDLLMRYTSGEAREASRMTDTRDGHTTMTSRGSNERGLLAGRGVLRLRRRGRGRSIALLRHAEHLRDQHS
jgi:hypothetical protein